MSISSIRVAASQHNIPPSIQSWEEYANTLRQQADTAAERGSTLLVFPEYVSLLLVPLLPPAHRLTLHGQLNGLQQYATAFLQLFTDIAQSTGSWVVAPSFPLTLDSTTLVNRAWICGPQGQQHWQDKHHMTRFENELFAMSPGSGLTVVDTGHCRFGVAICYDSEFPDQVHALARQGAQIIAVPSCTDSLAGYHRVMYCARARAIENQCFLIQAPLRGEAPWCDAIDINVGMAGIFSPVDRGFPEDGTLALGTTADDWVIADCDLNAMEAVRRDGQVLNWQDQLRSKVTQ